MDQNHVNASVDWAIHNVTGKVGYPASQYLGECASAIKRELEHRTGKPAPATGTGYATGYMNRPGYLADIFNPVQIFNRNADYPKGSLFFNNATHHGGVYLNRVGNNASVWEQNADPDGSACHVTTRDGGRISHIMTPRVAAVSNSQPTTAATNVSNGQTLHLDKGTDTTTYNTAGAKVGSIHASDDTYDYTVRGNQGNRVQINSASGGGNGVWVYLTYSANGQPIPGRHLR